MKILDYQNNRIIILRTNFQYYCSSTINIATTEFNVSVGLAAKLFITLK